MMRCREGTQQKYKMKVIFMMQSERVKRAMDAVEDACGHCEICSPDCPIAVARRALAGLHYDLVQMESEQ